MSGVISEYRVRPATPDDALPWFLLSQEAFSGQGPRPEPLPQPVVEGQSSYVVELVTEDADDPLGPSPEARRTVVAKARDRHYDAYFGGRSVRTCGVASVAVAMEHRGAGVLTALMYDVLLGAVERGAVVALLYPTATGIYRKLGFEVVGEYHQVTMPTRELALVRGGDQLVLERADPSTVGEIRGVYDTWARGWNGTLTRTGHNFSTTDRELANEFTGATLVRNASGTCLGYALWNRTDSYHPDGKLDIEDFVALTPDAAAALLRGLATTVSVAPTTRWWMGPGDAARYVLGNGTWRVTDAQCFMLAILDVEGALSGRGYPEGLEGELEIEVNGMWDPEQDGRFLVRLSGGEATCVRTATGSDLPPEPNVLCYSARGLALAYANAAPAAQLRRAGMLTGGPESHDWMLDGLFSGARPAMRDSF